MTCEHHVILQVSPADRAAVTRLGICGDCGERIRIEHDDLLCLQLRGGAECDREKCPCIRKLAVPEDPWRLLDARADQLLMFASVLKTSVQARGTADASKLSLWCHEIALDLYRHLELRRDAEVKELCAQIMGQPLRAVG